MLLEQHRVEEDSTIKPGRANKRTRSTLFVDGEMLIHLLEDEVRRDNPSTPQDEGAKVKKRSAIPAGTYPVVLTHSPKFGRLLPLILNVPGFSSIRMHSGHDEEDTEGCLLTAGGFDADGDIIAGTSRKAEEKLMSVLRPAWERREEIKIVITNDFLEV